MLYNIMHNNINNNIIHNMTSSQAYNTPRNIEPSMDFILANNTLSA